MTAISINKNKTKIKCSHNDNKEEIVSINNVKPYGTLN
jgi:hypothetical protein